MTSLSAEHRHVDRGARASSSRECGVDTQRELLDLRLDLRLALRSRGERRGMSQSALSMRLGISVSHLNGILKGRARPGAALTRRIRDFVVADQKPAPFSVQVPLGRSANTP